MVGRSVTWAVDALVGWLMASLVCRSVGHLACWLLLCGFVGCLCWSGVIVSGAQLSYADGTLKYPKLPTSTDGCAFNITIPEPIA